MKTKNFPKKQHDRRKKVLIRLGSQLDKGVKNTPEGEVQLSEQDIKRIKKEMHILSTKLDENARDRRSKKIRV